MVQEIAGHIGAPALRAGFLEEPEVATLAHPPQ